MNSLVALFLLLFTNIIGRGTSQTFTWVDASPDLSCEPSHDVAKGTNELRKLGIEVSKSAKTDLWPVPMASCEACGCKTGKISSYRIPLSKIDVARQAGYLQVRKELWEKHISEMRSKESGINSQIQTVCHHPQNKKACDNLRKVLEESTLELKLVDKKLNDLVAGR